MFTGMTDLEEHTHTALSADITGHLLHIRLALATVTHISKMTVTNTINALRVMLNVIHITTVPADSGLQALILLLGVKEAGIHHLTAHQAQDEIAMSGSSLLKEKAVNTHTR